MKKFLAVSISMILTATVLAACNTKTNVVANPATVSNVQTMSATTAMSMQKPATTEVKKSEVTTIKAKSDKNITKTAEALSIQVDKVAKNYMNESDIVSVSRYALSAMNRSDSYKEGYQIGYDALNRMERDGVFLATISAPGIRATKSYESAYKVTAAALDHLASGRENTPLGAINLIEKMMGVTVNYEDEYRVGYEALRIIGQANNQTVRMIVSTALRSAELSNSYSNGAGYIKDAFRELRRVF